jgi:hypothetical protein
MRFSGTDAAFLAQATADVIPARAQMATTLGFHIILACEEPDWPVHGRGRMAQCVH